MPFYIYRCPVCEYRASFRLSIEHEPPRCKECNTEMARVFTPVMFNMGKPTHREESQIKKWEQEYIDYYEY